MVAALGFVNINTFVELDEGKLIPVVTYGVKPHGIAVNDAGSINDDHRAPC